MLIKLIKDSKKLSVCISCICRDDGNRKTYPFTWDVCTAMFFSCAKQNTFKNLIKQFVKLSIVQKNFKHTIAESRNWIIHYSLLA